MTRIARLACALALAALPVLGLSARVEADQPSPSSPAARPSWLAAASERLAAELVAQHGAHIRPRLTRGLAQVASLWRDQDGDAATFERFVRTHFAADQAARTTMRERLDYLHEQLDGTMLELGRALRRHTDLDLGPILPFDELAAAYDPSAHITDDLFANKLAFVVLLNFPVTTLEQKLASGPRWTPEEWAETRLADRYSGRIPAQVKQQIASAYAAADTYIATYNIWMHHLLDRRGQRLFPPQLRLISHWNLRDELKAQYSEPDGLPRQRMIAQVMERIVTQTIPQVVIDTPHVDWNPYSNQVLAATVHDSSRPAPPALAITTRREPDTRYARLLALYRAERLVDSYSPAAPTLIARRFDLGRELPEARVEQMLLAIVSSPLVPRLAKHIQARLGRPLEPFDIWYSGFRPRGRYTEAELDRITRSKYPTTQAFAADLPRILVELGFSPTTARWLSQRIAVDPARGAGHAMGAQRRGDKAHLRTRVGAGGMDYKGYNIAVHELGHNVEQTFSLYKVPHHALAGVPNNAFTEALAFVFQGRDLELLGLAQPDARSKALATLNDFWGTYEIAGAALVDMRVWRWMYAHPGATPGQLRQATIRIAKDVWNGYYAPVLGTQDALLLAIYSHMIALGLYLPDYPIGRMIAHQIEEQIARAGSLSAELERMAVQGRLTPDLWMQRATGAPVGPAALLAATERALATLE